MKKSFADICLEKSDKATPSPWRYNGIENPRIDSVTGFNSYMIVDLLSPRNAEFIAFSREALPEVARRLQVAIDTLRITAATFTESNVMCSIAYDLDLIANELEAMPEEK